MHNKWKQAVRWTLVLLGILLAINGIVMTAISNFTTGIVALWLLAMLLVGVGLWWDAIQKITGHGVMRAIKYAVLAGVLFTLGLCIFIGIYGQADTVDQTEDVILVLGCGVKGSVPTRPLVERLETAIQAYNDNPDAYILVSGGQGPQEDVSEADAMEAYLLQKGISPEKIIKESRSTSTSENYKYSKELLDERFSSYTLVVITNDFHIYRAKQLARLAGLEVHTMHAKTPLSGAAMMYIREVLAILKLWILKY